MRHFVFAAALILLSSLFHPAEAKSDVGLSAAFETYLKNRVHSETVIARRELTHAEICGVAYRAAERFKKEVKRGTGRNLEEHLTHDALLRLRKLERDCWPYRDAKPKKFKEGDEPPVVNNVETGFGGIVGDTDFGGIRNIEDDEDDSLEAKALFDHMRWHPDEYIPTSAEEAGDYAELAWEVSERGRELRAQLLEAKYEAFKAGLEEQFAYNRKESDETIRGYIAARQEAEGLVIRIQSQIRGECMQARDAAIAKWVMDNAPVGTAEDMSPITTSGETRRYTDTDGNKVTEYDNGARHIEYPDRREVTIEADGTKITEFPDGHVVRENPDGTIECLKDHPDGVLRIVSHPNGDTDYYLNGELVAHYWPNLFPNRLARHVDFIDPETGLTPVERYSPMRRFWHWLSAKENEQEPDVDWDDDEAIAKHLRDQLAAFKEEHPGVFDDETFDEFVDRRFFELHTAHMLRTGREGYTAEERREFYRIILTEWEAEHPESTMTLTDLIDKRKLEETIRNGTVTVSDIPLGLDVEGLRTQIGAYNDWLEAHPDRTQEEERERRQHAARLRNALKFQRSLWENLVNTYGEEILRKLMGEKRFGAMKSTYESLPKDIADDKVGGSVDPLDPDWPGRKPQTAQASFSSLNGFTLVNGVLIGPETTLTVIGVDGEERTPEPEEARAEQAGDDILVYVAPTVNLAGVVLRGNVGNVVLSVAPPAPTKQGSLSPLDGVVDIRNGQYTETFRVPDTLTNTNAPAAAHEVQIGQGLTPSSNPQAGTVAVREGEVAVMGQSTDAPTLGTAECSVEGPDNQTISDSVPAWGYEVQPQPVSAVNTWAPIFFQVAGLDPKEKLRVTFSPPETVDVQPDKTKVKAEDYLMMNQISQYRTSVVGPQPIGARVERLD